MRHYFTSDEHYGHENIIRLCKRPYSNAYEMNKDIIARHNAKVPGGLGSMTYHLGDMFWRTLSCTEVIDIIQSLHGLHSYVLGNHDEVFQHKGLEGFFASIKSRDSLNYDKHHIVLDHYAGRVWNKSHTGSWLLYGHSHGELPELGFSFDVGVDAHEFSPWSMDEIVAKMATKKQHHIIPASALVPGTEAHRIAQEN